MLTPVYSYTVQSFREKLANGDPLHVVMRFENGVTLTDEDFDMSSGITITQSFNSDSDVKFGKVNSRQMTARIIMSEKTRSIKWTEKFFLGFDFDHNGDNFWGICIGTFIGTRPNNIATASCVDFTAYDLMSTLDSSADDFLSGITYPIIVSDIFIALCNELGFDPRYQPIQNIGNRSFSSNRFTKDHYTYREVLEIISEACGCSVSLETHTNRYYIFQNTDQRLRMQFFQRDQSGFIPRHVTRDEIFSDEHSDMYDGMNWNEFDEMTWDEAEAYTWDEITGSFRLSRKFDGVYVAKVSGGNNGRYPSGSSGHIYTIKDNPLFILTNKTTQITNYVQPYYERLVDLGGVLPMTIECTGDPTVEAGDFIDIDLEDETVRVPIFYKTMTWNGFLTDTYETTAPGN